MALAAVQHNKAHSYPEKDIIRSLRAWWDTETGISGANDPFAAPEKADGSVFSIQPAMESLRIVNALVVIEKCVNFKVPVTVIKKGGYGCFDEMAADLVYKVRVLFDKKAS
jgi:hypothetical protein